MSGPVVNAAATKAASAVTGSKFSKFMNHPAGPKTIFFWAPMAKWALVIAGVKDMSRPAEKVSIPANLALMATGFIWVRWSMVITPVNYSLAAVNFFVGSTGLAQLYRVYDWRTKNPELAAAADKAAKLKKDAPAKA